MLHWHPRVFWARYSNLDDSAKSFIHVHTCWPLIVVIHQRLPRSSTGMKDSLTQATKTTRQRALHRIYARDTNKEALGERFATKKAE